MSRRLSPAQLAADNRAVFAKMRSKLERYKDGVEDKTLRAYLPGIAAEILTDVRVTSEGRGVPRDEGTLAKSGRTEVMPIGDVKISFGGAAAPYALFQHERTDLRHPNGGEARYLIRGVERWNPDGSTARRSYEAQVERLRERLAAE